MAILTNKEASAVLRHLFKLLKNAFVPLPSNYFLQQENYPYCLIHLVLLLRFRRDFDIKF